MERKFVIMIHSEYFRRFQHSGTFGPYNGVYYTTTTKLEDARVFSTKETAHEVCNLLNEALILNKYVVREAVTQLTLIPAEL